MNSSTWLHIDTSNASAHLVMMSAGSTGDIESVEGHAYRDITNPIELVSHALDCSYGDADSILMAAEMKGEDDLWLRIPTAEFGRVVALGDFQGICRRMPLGSFATGDGASWLTTLDGLQLDLPGNPAP